MACPQWSRVVSVVSTTLFSLLIATQANVAAQRPSLWEEKAASDSAAVHEGLSIFMSLAEKLSPAVANTDF